MAGNIILTLAFVLAVFSMLMYSFSFRGVKNTLNFGRLSFHLTAMLVIVASTLLMYSILTHQYQYGYIYNYSSDELPVGLLMSTFWAGQEGSFLLWVLFAVIIGIILQSYSAKREGLEPSVMAVYSLVLSFLLFMVSPLLKSPFNFIWMEEIFIESTKINPAFFNLPFLQGHLFSDPSSGQGFVKMSKELYASLQSAGISINEFIINGKGLNPLLQNFWMQIHPPVLFAGFALAAVPFTFAIAALLKNDYKDWVRQSFPWVLAAGAVLGLGIMLGGYWAYGVLGWGGYWAWDPVENSSLVPWVVIAAVVHTMIVQRKSQDRGEGVGRFAKTNLILSILAFILVLYSTFLTRSGILGDSSVHSFVDPGTIIYLFLIILVATFLLLGSGLIVYRWKYLSSQTKYDDNLLSRELSLFTSAVVLGASALIIFFGTSAPIFGVGVEISFYDEMHIPLAIIMGLLNGLSLMLKWKENSGEEIFKKLRLALILSVSATLLTVVIASVYDIMMILLAFSAYFSIFTNGEIALKIMKGNKKMLGSYMAHIGIAIFILGVIGSAVYSDEVELDLVKGEKQDALGYTVEFVGYQPIENNTKYAFNVDVKKGNSSYRVKPVMYISSFNQSLMREPDILEGFLNDVYISPIGYDDGTSHAGHGEKEVSLTPGEETEAEGVKILYAEFIRPDMGVMASGGDFQMGAKLSVKGYGIAKTVDLVLKKEGEAINYIPVELKEENLRIILKQIDPMSKKADIVITKLSGNIADVHEHKEVLSISASVKPFVSLVWIGTAVFVIGFFVSMFRRLEDAG